ncbi:PAS domain S-box protein, partial [bacterium]
MPNATSPEPRDWLRASLDSISDAVIATDSAARVTFMNPAAERLTGEAAETARNRPLRDVLRLLDEDTRRPIEIPLGDNGVSPAAVARRPLLIETEPADKLIETTVEPLRDASSGYAGAVLVLRDVTERVRAERALRESQERYRA